jgi:hypothetical protein
MGIPGQDIKDAWLKYSSSFQEGFEECVANGASTHALAH